jgi:glycosyltransferase involved in cell wall biosynthesis
MKVYLGDRANKNAGGMYAVLQGLLQYLPQYVELVDSVEAADVVHAHVINYHDVPVDKGLVVSSHGMLWASDNWGKQGHKLNSSIVSSYLSADKVICPSRFVAHAIQRATLIQPTVIPHGINPSEWTGESQGYVLWNKSRIDNACHYDDLHKLAGLSQRYFITTFGKTSTNVKVIGQVEPETMKKYVQGAGVYLNTTRESGAPCFGVLEALACGVPILSWNIGGTAEVIKHKVTGYLADFGNFEDLLEGLEYCFSNREVLSRNALECVQNYTWDKIVPLYAQVYQDALVVAQEAPLVSVIIPNYNLGAYVQEAVHSAVQQTYDQVEVIVIDDASTDDSLDRLKMFEEFPNVRVLKNPTNQHVSISRNLAIQHATGRYILPLDADDRLDRNAVKVLVEKLHSDRNLHIVSGKLRLYNENDLDHGSIGQWPDSTERDRQLHGQNRLPYCSMYSKELWKRS